MKNIDIGINAADRELIADGFKRLLADSYTLYLQTHNFHWNVERPQFREVLKLAQAADDESSASLVSDRMRVHEKTAWMLRATTSV